MDDELTPASIPEGLAQYLSEEETILPEIEVEEVDNPLPRVELLRKAATIVSADRNAQYGSPEDSFSTIADLWSVYLGQPLERQDVAALMILLKVARLQTNPKHEDSWIDIAGYAACGGTV